MGAALPPEVKSRVHDFFCKPSCHLLVSESFSSGSPSPFTWGFACRRRVCSPCRGGRGGRVEAKALGFRRESWGRGGFQRSGFQSGPGFYVCGNGRKENTAELLAALPVEPVGVRVSNRGEMAPRAAPSSGQISACVRSSVLPGRIL